MDDYVKHLADSYVRANDAAGDPMGLNFNGGVHGVVLAANTSQSAPQSGSMDTQVQPLSPGTQETYDRIIGKLPKVQVPAEPQVPQAHPATPPRSYTGDMAKAMGKKAVEGISGAVAARGMGIKGAGSGWGAIGAMAGSTLIDHWDEIPGYIEGIPFPKSIPSECDGATCDRLD